MGSNQGKALAFGVSVVESCVLLSAAASGWRIPCFRCWGKNFVSETEPCYGTQAGLEPDHSEGASFLLGFVNIC